MDITVFAVWLAVSLFPTPLHLVRLIDDPVSATRTTIDEYCYGDRIVTINGPHVAITDYGAQTLTEIDHQRRTYSITRFDEIAKAALAAPEAKSNVHVEVDRSAVLSRDAVEALIGAAYPSRRSARHDAILQAAAPSRGPISAESVESYALPSAESIAFEDGMVFRNTVLRVAHDLPPPAAMLIDPGAARVESSLTRTPRELEQLDCLPRH
ncbi:MAG TPA: hypothetical protein VKH35_16930 [Thermoanaerobaculia bacterium]|nr:hypothetical protein [Thermoanaerobaculia bacterium]